MNLHTDGCRTTNLKGATPWKGKALFILAVSRHTDNEYNPGIGGDMMRKLIQFHDFNSGAVNKKAIPRLETRSLEDWGGMAREIP